MNVPYEERGLSDVPEHDIVAFINHILCTECDLRVRRQLESSVSQFAERFDPTNRLFVALYHNEKLCALLGVDKRNETIAVLKWVFVDSGHRNAGLGSQLIDRAIDFAAQAGYARLILCTSSTMQAAHRLYLKKGFVHTHNVTFWRKPMQILECML